MMSIIINPGIKKYQFADEEIPSSQSSYMYPLEYMSNRNQPIDIIIADFERQVAILDKLFNCGTKFNSDWIVRSHAICPEWVEKFFANFDWRKIATTYNEAVEKVLATIASKREFYNHCENQLGQEYLRQHEKTVKGFQKLGDEQKGHNIIATPCQLGILHRGKSVRWAREVMKSVEFGLGAFLTGCMLLTHQERLMYYNDLYIDCAGDEYASEANGDFSKAPVFRFNRKRVEFDADWFYHFNDNFGSASVFLSQ